MVNDYKLLEADTPRGLQNEVLEFIERGWQPFGSPFSTVNRYKNVSFYQPITFDAKANE